MGAGIFWSKNFLFCQILLKHPFESILSKFRSYELTLFKSNSEDTSTIAAMEYMVRAVIVSFLLTFKKGLHLGLLVQLFFVKMF